MKSFIILDRSGSMASRWNKTKTALDEYVKGLPKKTKVFLAVFDNQYDQVVSGVEAGEWKGVPESVAPRGMTALFDAIGKMSTTISEKAKKKAQIVILTDGFENASREVTKDAAKKIVEGWKTSGFDVVYLGADFNGMSEAGGVGIETGQTLNYSSTNAAQTGAMLAKRSMVYASTGNADMSWSDEDRKKASK